MVQNYTKHVILLGKTDIWVLECPFIRISCSKKNSFAELVGSYQPEIKLDNGMEFNKELSCQNDCKNNEYMPIILFDELSLCSSDDLTEIRNLLAASGWWDNSNYFKLNGKNNKKNFVKNVLKNI